MDSMKCGTKARTTSVVSRVTMASLVIALFAAAPFANAQSGSELAKKKSCFVCHGEKEKKLGPAFTDVAKKYRGVPDAEAKIAAKIKQGGNGGWGKMAMPPQGSLTDAEIKTLTAWVLSLT